MSRCKHAAHSWFPCEDAYDVDHSTCERLRQCLFEVGLDPTRVQCTDDTYIGADGVTRTLCGILSGRGTEGFTAEEVDVLTDKAIAIANGQWGETR